MVREQITFVRRALDKVLDLDRFYKRILQVILDCALIVLCYLLAMALRLDGFEFVNTPNAWTVLFAVVPSTIVVFIRLGLYRAVLRFISSRALKTIIFGVLFSAIIMFTIDQIFVLPVPRSVPIIYIALLFCAIGGSRFGWRAIYRMRTSRKRENVVIYGAGETGRQLLDAIRYVGDYAVIAFIDDNKKLHGQEISSIKVYSPNHLDKLKQRLGIKAILLAIPSASRSQRRNIIERLEKHTLQIRTIPAIRDLVSGKSKINELKVVQIEELLGRDVVPPNINLLKSRIAGKVVMVTGAGGSIGSELCCQIIQQEPSSLLLLDVSEHSLYQIHDKLEKSSTLFNTKIVPILGSIQNRKLLDTIFSKFNVDTIYHAAAYKHVPLVEENVIEAIRNNIFGTETLVQSAISAKINALTLISTDKAVRPTNFMGASKRVAEFICQSYSSRQSDTCISMVRFGNVLGSSGSVIPRFDQQIKAGGPVTVTHPKITRFFMTIREAAQLVIQAGAMARGGDVFILDMGEPVEITDLALRMIRLHGLEPYFEDSTSAEIDKGDIYVKFSGLRPGEKLYEELLIGNNPTGTEHPRIMSADELYLENNELDSQLRKLLVACNEYNSDEIKNILLSMPIEFNPDHTSSDVFRGEKVDAQMANVVHFGPSEHS